MTVKDLYSVMSNLIEEDPYVEISIYDDTGYKLLGLVNRHYKFDNIPVEVQNSEILEITSGRLSVRIRDPLPDAPAFDLWKY